MTVPTIDALHHALAAHPDHAAVDQRLRPAARMVCDDARRSGLAVEQMLVALKSEWAAVVEHHRVPHGAARTELTSRFITLCIHAFYADERAPLADGQGPREDTHDYA